MAIPKLQDCTSVLIVEGYTDLLFYAEALEWLKKPSGVYIKEMGGSGNFRQSTRRMKSALDTFLSKPLLEQKSAIGILVDADTDPAATAQSLEGVLSAITGQKVKTGTWTAGPPRIGLFLAPGGGRQGEVETLVWDSWSNDPANAGQKQCVEAFLACMQGQGRSAHSPDKGRVGALLSVLSDEDPRLGPAARDRVFDFARPELAPLMDFLRPLVTAQPA